MIDLKQLEVWFVTGSQHLYGEEVLKQVAADSQAIAAGLSKSASMPVQVVFKPVLVGPDAIHQLCLDANRAENCVGLITWMHTFSPAKMWIAGLTALDEAVRPFPHAIQSRHPLVDDRHGLHESQPIGPRRPRVWVHVQSPASGPHGCRRPLAG